MTQEENFRIRLSLDDQLTPGLRRAEEAVQDSAQRMGGAGGGGGQPPGGGGGTPAAGEFDEAAWWRDFNAIEDDLYGDSPAATGPEWYRQQASELSRTEQMRQRERLPELERYLVERQRIAEQLKQIARDEGDVIVERYRAEEEALQRQLEDTPSKRYDDAMRRKEELKSTLWDIEGHSDIQNALWEESQGASRDHWRVREAREIIDEQGRTAEADELVSIFRGEEELKRRADEYTEDPAMTQRLEELTSRRESFQNVNEGLVRMAESGELADRYLENTTSRVLQLGEAADDTDMLMYADSLHAVGNEYRTIGQRWREAQSSGMFLTDMTKEAQQGFQYMASAAQGAMLSMSLLEGNIIGLTFSLIFLQFAGFGGVALAAAAATLGIGGTVKALQALHQMEENRRKAAEAAAFRTGDPAASARQRAQADATYDERFGGEGPGWSAFNPFDIDNWRDAGPQYNNPIAIGMAMWRGRQRRNDFRDAFDEATTLISLQDEFRTLPAAEQQRSIQDVLPNEVYQRIVEAEASGADTSPSQIAQDIAGRMQEYHSSRLQYLPGPGGERYDPRGNIPGGREAYLQRTEIAREVGERSLWRLPFATSVSPRGREDWTEYPSDVTYNITITGNTISSELDLKEVANQTAGEINKLNPRVGNLGVR